jgi:hypothetical protein
MLRDIAMATAANDNRLPTLAGLCAQRCGNRRTMATASPEVLELCQRRDEVLAAMIFKLERGL